MSKGREGCRGDTAQREERRGCQGGRRVAEGEGGSREALKFHSRAVKHVRFMRVRSDGCWCGFKKKRKTGGDWGMSVEDEGKQVGGFSRKVGRGG